MKKQFLLFTLFIISVQSFSQNVSKDTFKLYSTSFKFNLSGFCFGAEQKILKRMTLQIEGLYWGKNLVKINPQVRYYPKFFKNSVSYFGIGYYFKHKETDYTDSVRVIGTKPYREQDFHVGKFIHALTLNYGLLYHENIFNQKIRFEFNLGLGVRWKKSNRYGVLPNEEIDLREAFIMRPQAYQDTQGNFVIYPELNLTLTVVLPIKK